MTVRGKRRLLVEFRLSIDLQFELHIYTLQARMVAPVANRAGLSFAHHQLQPPGLRSCVH